MDFGDEVSLPDSWAEPASDREGGSQAERRRHRRFPLQLSVNVHLGGRPEPVTVDIVDIAARGVRFRSPAGAWAPGAAAGTLDGDGNGVSQGHSNGHGTSDARAGTGSVVSRVRRLDEASFGFVSREQHICVAHGRVLRVAARRSSSQAPSDLGLDAAAGSTTPGESPNESARPSAPEAARQLMPGDEFVVSVERANAAFHSFLAMLTLVQAA